MRYPPFRTSLSTHPHSAGVLAPLLLLTLAAGCGGDDDGPTLPENPPTVTSSSLASGATNVRLLQDVLLTFSEAMDPATLNATTVTVGPGGVDLHLEYDEQTRQLWVAPLGTLPADAQLTLSVSQGAKNEEGAALEPYSLPFSTGPMTCSNLDDRFEPNDAVGDPTDLPLDVPVVALSTCGDDEDFYRVTLTERAKVFARTSVRIAEEDSWGVHWLREDGGIYATLGARANAGSDNLFGRTFEPGSYVVRVFGHDEEELVAYDFMFETREACGDDAYEDNDFLDESVGVDAGVLEGLRGCYLDADWFSVPVEAGQTVRLTIDPGTYASTTRLQIALPGGGGGQVTNATVLEHTAAQDGVANVMAMFWGDGVTYDLTIEVFD